MLLQTQTNPPPPPPPAGGSSRNHKLGRHELFAKGFLSLEALSHGFVNIVMALAAT